MKNDFDLQKWLPVGILVASGGLLFYAMTDHGPSPKKEQSARSVHVQETVNKHLERTAEQLEMQRKRMQIENSRLVMDYDSTVAEHPYVPPREGSELMQAESAQAVARDLGVNEIKSLPSNPTDLIHSQLFERQQAQQYNEAYKKEYARQFIENARRGGWEIQLTPDYKIQSVRPIRKPSGSMGNHKGQDLFGL